MARVVLSTRECDENRLPNVCVYCGAPTQYRKPTSFRWLTPFAFFLVIFGFVPFLIAAMILTWRKSVAIPLCATHRLQGLNIGTQIFFGTLMIGVGLLGFALIAEKMKDAPWGLYIIPAVVVGAGLTTGLVASFRKVGAMRISHRSITLRGVHTGFISALEELRASNGWTISEGRPPERSNWIQTLPNYGESRQQP